MRATPYVAYLALLLSLTPLIASGTVYLHPDYFFNFSKSAPRGVWHLQAIDGSAETYELGDWVAVCPPLKPDEFRLLFGIEVSAVDVCSVFILKQVAAIPGDEVTVTHRQIQTPIAVVEGFDKTPTGIKLPSPAQGIHAVRSDSVWVINNHHVKSVDSRYFGAIPTRAIVARTEPIWTVP